MRLFLFLLIALGLWSQGLQAQGVVSERGQAAVRVYNENYVRARESAITIAKKDILTRTMTQFLKPEDVEQLYPVLENRLLNEPDSFIESTRVIEEFADDILGFYDFGILGRVQTPLKTNYLYLWRHHDTPHNKLPRQSQALGAMRCPTRPPQRSRKSPRLLPGRSN